MLSSERNGDPDLCAATSDERNDRKRSLAHSHSSTELDRRIKNLTCLIEAKFLSRTRFLDESTQLRALLNAQLATAQTLIDRHPVFYFPPPDALNRSADDCQRVHRCQRQPNEDGACENHGEPAFRTR
jgi:hypothetical protein